MQRLADLWAMGEAGASLGFATARLFDQLDPIEREKNALLAARNVKGSRATMKAMGIGPSDANRRAHGNQGRVKGRFSGR